MSINKTCSFNHDGSLVTTGMAKDQQGSDTDEFQRGSRGVRKLFFCSLDVAYFMFFRFLDERMYDEMVVVLHKLKEGKQSNLSVGACTLSRRSEISFSFLHTVSLLAHSFPGYNGCA
ncbi:hypothetical protein CRENBAI_023763 [Crenichthys baileyi]|uniref:Uncharacterized protein n=1 Tax=Crenichthys baileyi TaxID=28760 RepID=A0AAV9QYI7_9TELE